MTMTRIRMASYNWDHFQPLACGDVQPAGIELIMRRGKLGQLATMPDLDMTETSLSLYLMGLARGERDMVGLPVFPMRSFRHRCFLVRRDSPLKGFADVTGKRIGTDGWANSGNTWSRAALREGGVDISSIDWVVGDADEFTPARPQVIPFPPFVRTAPQGTTLVRMLLAEELDALMIPFPPPDFFQPDSPIVHLFPDFRTVEQAYFARVGYCPAQHVIVMRRSIFEQDPTVAVRLVAVVEESKRRWRADRRRLADTTPWILRELEETAAILGEDWQPYGVAPNAAMLAAFCVEQFAQGLVPEALDPALAFAEYQAIVTSSGGDPS